MFQTILYRNKDITLERLSSARWSKFFKLYEDSMLAENSKPLVSFTSGAGILDYKRMLEQLSGAYASQKTPSIFSRIFRRKR